jgi:hypothetical protein
MYKIESPEDGGNGPNFLLIVVLAVVSMLVLFGVAYLVIPGAAASMRDIVKPNPHPTSQLVLRVDPSQSV